MIHRPRSSLTRSQFNFLTRIIYIPQAAQPMTQPFFMPPSPFYLLWPFEILHPRIHYQKNKALYHNAVNVALRIHPHFYTI